MKFKRAIMWMTLTAIGLLAVLSVFAAFWGAEKARLFFNSVPLWVYWYGLLLLLAMGFIEFPRLLKKPALFMIHMGCLLVLGASMWGSQAGHQVQSRFLGSSKIPRGYMAIVEGDTENRVFEEDFVQKLGDLPFSVKLKDFRIEYYDDSEEKLFPRLYIKTRQGENLQLLARAGEKISLGPQMGRLKIVRTFRNFKIGFEDGKKMPVDEQNGEENPAVEVAIESPDGNTYTRYVFERFRDFNHVGEADGLQLNYVSQGPRVVRDFFSDVIIIENGKEKISRTIEVNHPLHYKGYHFYQHSYDSNAGAYTILSVVSDSGLYGVYAGYWLLFLGVFWQLWFRHIADYFKKPLHEVSAR